MRRELNFPDRVRGCPAPALSDYDGFPIRDPARIDGLILADSIYCGYTGDVKDHKVDPALMDGFRRFAIEAATGRKTLLMTYSVLTSEGYASTAETADFLIDTGGGKADPVNVDWPNGWLQTRAFVEGRFVVLGFAGTEGADHMSHPRQIRQLWKRYHTMQREM